MLKNNVETNNLKTQAVDEKNVILESFFEQISPATFYEILFVEDMQNILYIIENQTYKAAPDIISLLELSSFRSDIFVPPATFFKKLSYKERNLNKLYAFVIDLDNVKAEMLMLICQKIASQYFKFVPTLILNSGGGLHLYYVLTEPIDCFHSRHDCLKLILGRLQEVWQSRSYKVDKKTTLIQPYRVAGSLNKYGQKTACYRVGEKYRLSDLAKQLQVDLWQNKSINSTVKNSIRKRSKYDAFTLPNAGKRFYYHCLFRIAEEVDIGHRYLSLFALAIVGYKCRITKEKVEKDITNLVNFFNANKTKNGPVLAIEITKAMQGFSNRFVRVKSFQLEEWFGFNFPRKSKRNGRKRNEHLAFARAVKRLRKQSQDKDIFNLYKQGLSMQEISKKVGLSIKTVCSKTTLFCKRNVRQKQQLYKEISQLKQQGFSNKEVSKKLNISLSKLYRIKRAF